MGAGWPLSPRTVDNLAAIYRGPHLHLLQGRLRRTKRGLGSKPWGLGIHRGLRFFILIFFVFKKVHTLASGYSHRTTRGFVFCIPGFVPRLGAVLRWGLGLPVWVLMGHCSFCMCLFGVVACWFSVLGLWASCYFWWVCCVSLWVYARNVCWFDLVCSGFAVDWCVLISVYIYYVFGVHWFVF